MGYDYLKSKTVIQEGLSLPPRGPSTRRTAFVTVTRLAGVFYSESTLVAEHVIGAQEPYPTIIITCPHNLCGTGAA